ncbi:DNA methyltransferase [Rhodoblastus sp.]|uniref:DNA methyltransferase n=1 Tax=Rhodoblastus sp. TaxID=1962975 RepID=UPI003FD7A4B8
MSKIHDDLSNFLAYAKTLDGDEKGEAQVFCDRLFQAFGHKGYKEAGATLEYRIKKGKSTSFADLIWKPRLLIEMKKAGEKLHLHYGQAFEYWLNAVPNRPRYVVLCNFREFWIYDFDRQLNDPVDVVALDDLPKRYTALNFLFPDERKPLFDNDREAVSRTAADQVAELFRHLTKRASKPVPRPQAQRFVLQIVLSMFAEDIDLLPAGTVQGIIDDCIENKQSSYDLFGGLFQQMNSSKPAMGGRFKGVRYFNGGLFSKIEPVELTSNELALIGGKEGAASKDWSKVNPAIFGTLFQHSMDAAARHAFGAHFTSEADIQRIVTPTIVRPWRDRIDTAKNATELLAIRLALMKFKVLDPACGSGNFLYVAFRELSRLDLRIMSRLQELLSAKEFQKRATTLTIITPKQFFGIDIDPFGVELAKVTLMLAKKLAFDEAAEALNVTQEQMALGGSDALPLDNLDANILCEDALFSKWPDVDAIIGNPPYQSKNKLQAEMDRGYINSLRARYPEIDGRSDYCVYWFRRAHDHLKAGQRAGLVGTNTIRQNYSREAGLDYIVNNGGTITEAVSSMIWSGEAVVHVSIVNWIRGAEKGKKRLYIQEGNIPDTGWRHSSFGTIGASLSFSFDVTQARRLEVNARLGGCFQGQTHGHKAFLMSSQEAKLLIAKSPKYRQVVFPFLIADDLIGERHSKPTRYVIDFQGKDVIEAQGYGDVFQRIKSLVLPTRQKAAEKETDRNKEVLAENKDAKVNHHHANFLKKWWLMSYPREELIASISSLSRYVVCGRVTKRPIFEFVSNYIRPNDALQVFPYDDDYSFGILQSGIHWEWFTNRCSTLKSDYRYTSNTVFDTFPWPQKPSAKAIKAVAVAAVALRAKRAELRAKHNLSLRDLYRSLELPGDHPLKAAHAVLDDAVRKAYGMSPTADPLAFLLDLNAEVAEAEANGDAVQGSGLPSVIHDRAAYVSKDCIEA